MQRNRLLSFAFLFAIVATASQPTNSMAEMPTLSAAEADFDAEQLDRIDQLVADEIERGNLPGCVVMIGRRGQIGFAKAYGHRQLEPSQEKMTLDTVFDMASLTKPVATATSIMLLVERGQVRLRELVATYIPEFSQQGKEAITVEHLLTHQAGLIPDNPLGDYQHGTEEAWKRIWALKPRAAIGEKFIYTDVGFLVLGEIVRRVTGQSVAEFAAENIYQPAGMNETGYLPREELHSRTAPTEQRDGQWLRGEVHDPRAALLEGVAGHAGLFSTAHDLAIYADMMLAGGKAGDTRILSPATIAEMCRPRDIAGNQRALGWDSRSKYSSNRGETFSTRAFGHGGFTGTAMWIDPGLDLFVIFLSNRLHPDGEGSVNPLAGKIGSIAAAADIRDVDSSTSHNEESPAVLLGIDLLEQNQFRELEGRRVGLITNHTGLNADGQRTVDLLHAAPQVELVLIFSPEHGLQGKLDQSNIDDTRDEVTNLPVHSLYGKSRRPEPEELAGLDTLVFDIQDIGCRFYTYISTMGHAMKAAAEHDLRFVVLDRPNPIGGVLVEGPLLDAGDESFVGYHPISLRHGMTVGELARMIQQERGWEVDLQIIPVKNWRRDDYWDRTGLTWTNPSPNMRSLVQAVLYPGVGLLETTNVSVGRGTDTPFEVLGAPWIEGRQLARELNSAGLPGVRFIPIEFTPNASKYTDQLCQGVNITVVDRAKFRSVVVGLEIAHALRKLYPNDWKMNRFNRLLINQEIFDAIAAGKTPAEITPLYEKQREEFLKRRQKFLLYR